MLIFSGKFCCSSGVVNMLFSIIFVFVVCVSLVIVVIFISDCMGLDGVLKNMVCVGIESVCFYCERLLLLMKMVCIF